MNKLNQSSCKESPIYQAAPSLERLHIENLRLCVALHWMGRCKQSLGRGHGASTASAFTASMKLSVHEKSRALPPVLRLHGRMHFRNASPA